MRVITLNITGLLNPRGLLTHDWKSWNFDKKTFSSKCCTDISWRTINPGYSHVVNKLWARNYYPDSTEKTLTRKTDFGGYAPLVPDGCMITELFINPLIDCFIKLVIVFQYIFILFHTTCRLRFFFKKGKNPRKLRETCLKSSF